MVQEFTLGDMLTPVATLKDTLKASSYSLTNPRQQIFKILEKHGPLSTVELTELCDDNINRATVYRTVELFENLGVINRLWYGFKSTIELSEIFTPHHHHAVCNQCGTTIDIASTELEFVISKLAKKHEFLALGHSIELRGYCKDCQ